MGHLRVLQQTLKEHQLYAKYSKCEFSMRSVTFLGDIISSEVVEVDPKKMQAVKNMPTPLTQSYIRSFLSLAGSYRRFVYGFTSIASTLTTLTQKSKRFEWSEACEGIF